MKVLLMLMDGMRPDSLPGIPEAQAMIARGSSAMDAQTVYPSVTLPCHMSLFHSVDPSRHGTTTNIFMPQVRPINGLFDVLKMGRKRTAMFYNWHELRDLGRPGSLSFEYYLQGCSLGWEETTVPLTDAVIEHIQKYDPDFTFYYFAYPDEMGHAHGWMTEKYQYAVEFCWKEAQRIIDTLPEDYVVIVVADHGGHDRTHGTDMPEDMNIPVIITGGPFAAGAQLENASIKDIAPTIAALLGVEATPEWEGKVLYNEG
jgi:predicted AlkP superfamily pyrophosphatase or phosphodiesterase